MKTIIKIILTIFPSIFIQGQSIEEKSIKEFNSEQTEKFSSLGEGKSLGLKLHFKYPKSWKSIEGERPHVLRKFAQSDNHTLAIILLQKTDKPASQKELNDFYTASGLKSMMPANSIFISCQSNLKIEQLPAGCIEYSTSAKRVDRVFYTHTLNYIFTYKNYIVTIQFVVADSPDETSKSVDKRYKTLQPLFHQMFNSIVIDNIYEK